MDFKSRKENPESRSNFFSRVTYSWLTHLLKEGLKRSLQEEDVYELPNRYRSKFLLEQYRNKYEKYVFDNKRPASLLRLLLLIFGKPILTALMPRILSDISIFTIPLLLRVFIKTVEDKKSWVLFDYVEISSMIIALLLLLSMFFILIIGSLSFRYYYQLLNMEGLAIVSLLNSLTYQKCMKTSSRSQNIFSSGRIVNLLSMDSKRVGYGVRTVHFLWSGLFQILLSILFLFIILGPATFVGLFLLLLTIPLQVYLMSKLRRSRFLCASLTDRRVKLSKEVLANVYFIKTNLLEQFFIKKIEMVRRRELVSLRSIFFFRTILLSVNFTVPVLATILSFIFFYMNEHSLPPGIALPSLMLFSFLKNPFSLLPVFLNLFIDARVSLRRIEEFLTSNNEDMKFSLTPMQNEAALIMKNVTFRPWADPSISVIKNVSLSIPFANHVAIIGQVGTGKSSLLEAIYGTLEKVSGNLSVFGTVGYCPQDPFIPKSSIKDTIVFGNVFDPVKYRVVLDQVNLKNSIDLLPNKDETILNENLIGSSLALRRKLYLARLLYSGKEIILLDDSLGLMDKDSEDFLFYNCIKKGCRGKTVIFVTMSSRFLTAFDWIILLKEGRVYQQGPPETFLSSLNYGDVNELFSNFKENLPINETNHLVDDGPLINESGSLGDQASYLKHFVESTDLPEEERNVGPVHFSTYISYLKQSGSFIVLFFLLVIILVSQFSIVGLDLLLAFWSKRPSFISFSDDHFIWFSLILFTIVLVSVTLVNISSAMVSIRASGHIYPLALRGLLRKSIDFFKWTPMGRMVNRFSGDIDLIDDAIFETFKQLFIKLAIIAANLIIISILVPIVLLIFIPIVTVCFFIQKFYRTTSRELNRLASVLRSPYYSHVTDTLREFRQQYHSSTSVNGNIMELYQNKHHLLLDKYQAPIFLLLTARHWIGIRLDLVGDIFVLASSLVCVFAAKDSNICLLIFTNVLTLFGSIFALIDTFIKLEVQMNSMDRLNYYIQNPQDETNIDASAILVKRNLKEEFIGKIKMIDISLQTSTGKDTVFNCASLTIGASSLISLYGGSDFQRNAWISMSLKEIHPLEGAILLSHRDLTTFSLADLRSDITYISLKVALFQESLRFNLDPSETVDDEKIWWVLDGLNMRKFVEHLSGKLDFHIKENGDGLSFHEKLLIGLARGILRPSTKILIVENVIQSLAFHINKDVVKFFNQHRTQNQITMIVIGPEKTTRFTFDKEFKIANDKIIEIID